MKKRQRNTAWPKRKDLIHHLIAARSIVIIITVHSCVAWTRRSLKQQLSLRQAKSKFAIASERLVTTTNSRSWDDCAVAKNFIGPTGTSIKAGMARLVFAKVLEMLVSVHVKRLCVTRTSRIPMPRQATAWPVGPVTESPRLHMPVSPAFIPTILQRRALASHPTTGTTV